MPLLRRGGNPLPPTENDAPEPMKNPFADKIFTLSALYAEENPRDWMVKGLFCRGDVGMLYGASQTGKSFVTIDLAMALAAGTPSWCGGLLEIPTARRVVYCAGEGRGGLQKRFFAAENLYRNTYACSFGAGSLHVVKEVPQLFQRDDPYNVQAFIEEILGLQLPSIDLVIIDTKATASYGADENDNSDTAVVLRNVARMQEALGGGAVLLDHHCGKDGLYRGASALYAGVDFSLRTRVDGENAYLQFDKVKDEERPPDQAFALQRVETPWEPTCVVAWQGQRQSATVFTWSQVLAEYAQTDTAREPHTAREIAEILAATTGKAVQQKQVKPYLDRMIALFQHALQKPGQDDSSRNPRVYWVATGS